MTAQHCGTCWYCHEINRDGACRQRHRHVCDNERSAWYGSRVAPDHVCDEHSPAAVDTDVDEEDELTRTGDA